MSHVNIDLNATELKDREMKNRYLFLQMIWIGLKKKKEMQKIRLIKKTCYAWLIIFLNL